MPKALRETKAHSFTGTVKRMKKLNQREKTQVKRMIGRQIEDKHFYYGGTGGIDAAAGSITDMSLVPQGVTQISRVGDTITLKRIDIRFQLESADSALLPIDNHGTIRCIVFRWEDNSSVAAPIVTDVLTPYSALDYIVANYNADNIQSGKVKILYDRLVTLFNQATYTGSAVAYYQSVASVQNRHVVLYGKRLGKKRVYFNGGGTTGKDKIYIMFISDSTANPHPAVQWQSLLTYSDA